MSLFDPELDRDAFIVDGLHYTVTVGEVSKKFGVTRSWVIANAQRLRGIRRVWPGREEWRTSIWRFPEELIEEIIYSLTREG